MNEISRSSRTKNVLDLQVARERARQLRGGSNGHVSKRLGLSGWNSETPQLCNQRLLERLEGENSQLRGSAVDLMLQIQALRDRCGADSATSTPRRGTFADCCARAASGQAVWALYWGGRQDRLSCYL
jgi:hypothetical protein